MALLRKLFLFRLIVYLSVQLTNTCIQWICCVILLYRKATAVKIGIAKNDSVWNELAGTISNPSWFLVFILFKSKWKMFLFSLFLFCYSVTYLHQIIEIFHLISFSCGLKKKKWKINRYPNMIKLTHAFCWLFSKLYRIFSVLSIFNILLIPL